MKRTVVVGGGAIGLACAYALARRGRQVTVLDKGAPGDACTKGNAGWIVPSLSAPIPAPGMTWTSLRWMLSSESPLYIAPAAAPRLARWLWRFWRHCNARDFVAGLHAVATLNRGTLAAFDALAREGIEVELHRDGLLCVFGQPTSMEAFRAEFDVLREYGYAVPDAMSGDDVRALEPALSDQVTCGCMIPAEYHVRPESLASGYAAKLASMGVEIRAGVTVLGGRA
ncbi:MAG: FAD-dependent oxidoreductase, partial [Gemmatimonadetes bacterium]|nr:FAD-dependent oxidoreductase [Gemmatimonadota bacterium]